MDTVIFSPPNPIGLAHRGGAAEAPENSLAAIEHTIAVGFDHLETDVHLTSDGVVVLMHDPEVDRTTNGAGRVQDYTWKELQQLRDASGRPPVRLREVLADFPELRLNIDLKEDRVVGPTLRDIVDARAQSRVCLASFEETRLRVVRRITAGTIATSLGRSEVVRLVLAARAPRRLRSRISLPGPAVDRTRGAVAVQVPPTFRGRRIITPEFLDVAHRQGLQVHAWTINEPVEMQHLLDLGVDGLVTDYPTQLRRVLRERGQWPTTST